ncbi:MAG: carbon-nitrogen hydrolase family protein [Deltaproteobacteria bacterium]|nr:carbon-nitrogen hydrolase family protein [Deltaproteobacteria bacterium]
MTANIRAAVVQLTSRQNVEENLEACVAAAAEAAGRGAQLCAFPENFAYMGPERGKLALAETVDVDHPGPILGRMMAIARQHGMHVLCGGFPERSTTAGKCLNASVLLGPDGRILGHYRKMHLFDVSIPGRAEYRESEVFEGGPGPVVARTDLGAIGLSVCYDLRFPELYRAEAAAGARILAVPSAFTAHTGAAHWHVLVRARAVENECFVLAPNQVGTHTDKVVTYGHSLIVDPWGTILAEVGDGPGVAVADLDLA